MSTVAVLKGASGIEDEVSRQLHRSAEIELCVSPATLAARVAGGRVDAVVLELEDARGKSVAPVVLELSAIAPALQESSPPRLPAVSVRGGRITFRYGGAPCSSHTSRRA